MAKVKASDKDDDTGDAEKRDAILRRMLNTPPKPRKGKGGKQTRSEK